MDLDVKLTVRVFKAFGDENRIRILLLLLKGEQCACRLLEDMNITQPTLSHHMKILCDSGVVSARKEGKWMYYSISPEGAEFARECLDTLVTVDNTQISLDDAQLSIDSV